MPANTASVLNLRRNGDGIPGLKEINDALIYRGTILSGYARGLSLLSLRTVSL